MPTKQRRMRTAELDAIDARLVEMFGPMPPWLKAQRRKRGAWGILDTPLRERAETAEAKRNLADAPKQSAANRLKSDDARMRALELKLRYPVLWANPRNAQAIANKEAARPAPVTDPKTNMRLSVRTIRRYLQTYR